jgi:hypothetical protein
VLAYQFNPDFGLFYLAAALPAGAAVALFGLLFYRLLMLVYGVYVGMLIGMVIEAGVSNATDMDDEHQCTASPPSSFALNRSFRSLSFFDLLGISCLCRH